MRSLSVLMSAVETSRSTRTALELAWLLLSEIIRTRVCVLCILAMAAIQVAFISLTVPDCAATIQEQWLFENGVYSKKYRYGDLFSDFHHLQLLISYSISVQREKGLENLVICSGIS